MKNQARGLFLLLVCATSSHVLAEDTVKAITQDKRQALTSTIVAPDPGTGRRQRWQITYDADRNHITGNTLELDPVPTFTPGTGATPSEPTPVPGTVNVLDCDVRETDPDNNSATLGCQVYDASNASWAPENPDDAEDTDLPNANRFGIGELPTPTPTPESTPTPTGPTPTPTVVLDCFPIAGQNGGGRDYHITLLDSCGLKEWGGVKFIDLFSCDFYASIDRSGDGRQKLQFQGPFPPGTDWKLKVSQAGDCSGKGDFCPREVNDEGTQFKFTRCSDDNDQLIMELE